MATNPRTYSADETREISDALQIVRSSLDGAFHDLADGIPDRIEQYRASYTAALAVLDAFEITTYLTRDFDAEVARAMPAAHLVSIVADGPFKVGHPFTAVATVFDQFVRPLHAAAVSWDAVDAETGTAVDLSVDQIGWTASLTLHAPGTVTIRAHAEGARQITGGTQIVVEAA